MNENEANWKVFRRETEAGRLLSRLYHTSSSQKVTYPKPKQRRRQRGSAPEDDQKRQWRTTYTCHGWSKAAEEEKESERKNNIARALSLTVPKVGCGNSRHTINNGKDNRGLVVHVAKVDQIPRRRSEHSCRHDQEKVGFANKKYRPPCSHAKSSDQEKQRLASVFDAKGGKCLPEDLTSLPSSTDGGDIAKSPCGEQVEVECNTLHPQANTLFDQIYQEIVERRQYQLELEVIGAGLATRDQVANEIRVRVEHLKKIDPMRAALIVQHLTKL